jgi:peptidoglycan/xylan/chitin deacetylase (PgdA/CDA1 family)
VSGTPRLLLALAAGTLLIAGCGGVRAFADDDVRPLATSTVVAVPVTLPTATPTPLATPEPTPPPPTSTPTAAPRVLAQAAPASAAAGSARAVFRGPTNRKFIALTFDAGADVGYTALILDTLRAKGVHASFGMTGAWAEAHPDLVRRMAAEGHDFINHTYSHDSFTGVSTGRRAMQFEERASQIERTERVVAGLTGQSMRPYFRPPYGDYDASVNADLARLGFTQNVLWTIDSTGWRGVPAGTIVDRCLSNAAPGAIIVFHVGSQSLDGPALAPIVDGLRQQGYALGTIRELIEG